MIKILKLTTKRNKHIEEYELDELDDNFIKLIYSIYEDLCFKYLIKSIFIKKIKVNDISSIEKEITFILFDNCIYKFYIVEVDLSNDSK